MSNKTAVEKHFDEIASDYDKYKKNNSFYYNNLKKLLKSTIPADKKVLEIGCGTGDILVSLMPKKGYGMDLSSRMVSIAKRKHGKSKYLTFSTSYPKEKYDYIFMTDVIEHLEEPEKVFKKISSLMHKNSIFVNTMANPRWEPLLMFWEKMGWKMPEGDHNRIEYQIIKKILKNAGLRVVKHDFTLLIPIKIGLLTTVANKFFQQAFKKFCFIEYFVVKKI